MKKKRLLAVFAAFALAATMAIGFTACEDKEENVEPDNSITDNTENENNENIGEGSVLTETEWKKAIADSLAATSYTIMSTENMIRKFGKTDTYDENGELIPMSKYVIEREINGKYDGVNGVAYFYQFYINLGYSDGSLVDSYERINENYLEIFDLQVIFYDSKSDGAWSKTATSFSTHDEIEEGLMEVGIISSLFGASYKIPGTNDAKTIDKLFNQFTYDKNTNAYSANLIVVAKNGAESREMTFTLKFANGKLYSYEMGYAEEEGDTTVTDCITYVFSDYNSVTVNIPQEVKDSLDDIE